MSAVLKTIENGSDLIALRDLIRAGEQPIEGAVIIPDGYKLDSLERFQVRPDRLRGSFVARSIDQFAGYAALYSMNESTVIFVDDEKLSALMILNHGHYEEPEWGDHRAQLALKHTPEWAALLEVTRTTQAQGSLIDYALEWSEHLELKTQLATGRPDPTDESGGKP